MVSSRTLLACALAATLLALPPAAGSLAPVVAGPGEALAASPVATDDVFAVAAGAATAIGVSANDLDTDGGMLVVTSATTPAHGTAVPDGAGGVVYTPDAGWLGEDSFGYTVSDGATSDTGAVRVFVNAPIDGSAARAAILAGVSTLGADGYGGPVLALGPTAFPLTEEPRGSGALGGWRSALATMGAGRVVAMGDHQDLEMASRGASGDTALFYVNAIAWLADDAGRAIRIVTLSSSNATWLASQGFTNVVSTNLASLPAALVGADVLVAGWLGSNVSQSSLDAITAFVEAGGGLFLADFGWGYTGWWNKPIPQAPGNLLLRGAGLGFRNGIFWDGGPVAATAASGQPNADFLFDVLADGSGRSDEEKRTAGIVLDGMSDFLPSDDLLLALADRFYAARIGSIHATPATPVSDTLDQVLLRRQAQILEATPASLVTAHPDAATLYGAIPAGTPRVTRTVSIDGSRGRWHPTGLYAAPGELVTVTVPADLVGKGYKIRVNAHTDDVSARSSWWRPPRVHRSFAIDATTVQVANAFGGSIFVDLGGGAESASPGLGAVSMTLAGAIDQPWFELGRHTDAQWLDTLRSAPAPWAVLATPNVVLSIPSSYVRELAEADRLATWWNDVVAHEDALAAHLSARTGAELINIDVQNSAGAAHSGFPIQAWDVYWGNPADLEALSCEGSWGDFHELGHNHQRGWWTFSGDGEVTCNVFANEALEAMATDPTDGWGYSAHPDRVMSEAVGNVAGGSSYASRDRWSFWFQLADGFGWDAYRSVFAGYERDAAAANAASLLPQDEQQKRDQWFVRWSQQVGYDMKRFMVDTWGLQVSPSALAATASLPAWMPLAGGVTRLEVIGGTSTSIDLGGAGLSMDGTATLVSVDPPGHGKLVDEGGGSWRYTPTAGFLGTDRFSYVLRSSAGNTQSFDATVEVVTGVVAEYWYGIAGNQLSALTSDPRFPASPDESRTVSTFELPSGFANAYGARVRGFVVPPTTGDYTFWIASDDEGALLLSSDDAAANAVQVASVPGYTNPRAWTRYPEQRSAPVRLAAGRRYYLEARVKEGGGGDHLSVAWSGPGVCGPRVIPASAARALSGPSPTCPAEPSPTCAQPGKTKVKLQTGTKGGRLLWSWSKGTATIADFGAPDATTTTRVCIYDDRGLLESAVLPPGGNCGGRPCWRTSSKGFAFVDKAGSNDGVVKLLLGGSPAAGRAGGLVDAKGTAVSPTLPVQGTLVVQLGNDATNACFSGNYSGAQVKKSDGATYQAVSP